MSSPVVMPLYQECVMNALAFGQWFHGVAPMLQKKYEHDCTISAVLELEGTVSDNGHERCITNRYCERIEVFVSEGSKS